MIDFERRARLAAEIASEQPTEVLRLKDISDPTKAYAIGHRRGALWAFDELENWRESIREDNVHLRTQVAEYEQALKEIQSKADLWLKHDSHVEAKVKAQSKLKAIQSLASDVLGKYKVES